MGHATSFAELVNTRKGIAALHEIQVRINHQQSVGLPSSVATITSRRFRSIDLVVRSHP